MKRAQPETQLQRAVIHYIRMAAPHALCFAVPNGGKRSKIEAAIMKSTGVMPGVADLLLFWQREIFKSERDLCGNSIAYYLPEHGAIELKAGKNTVTPTQKDFRDKWAGLGGKYALCRSLDDVQAALKMWGVI